MAGGNAFDAAVAAGFALHVVEPHMNGIGGEAPALLYSSKSGSVIALSGQGPAPAAASLSYFRDLGIKLIPGDGFLPATIPASLELWITLLREFGTMRLSDVLTPAIRLAEEGFPVYPTLARSINIHARRFATEWPSTARIFLPGGEPPKTGEFLVQKDLGKTLRRLAAAEKRAGGTRRDGLSAARRHFYSGPVARQIVNFSSTKMVRDASGQAHHGLIRLNDLSGYHTRFEEPVSAGYRGLVVHKCGPWSQGPVFLQQLRLIEEYDLGRLGHNSADYIHLITEASKLAFADREQHYGDPSFTRVPLRRLLSAKYATQRRKLINPRLASSSLGPDYASSKAEAVGSPGDTTHLDVADSQGNLVSVTPSGGWITDSPVIEGLGFPLGTRGQMFSLREGHPNCIAPNKRPRTTLSPTLVTRRGSPFMAFGTPGGDQQDQWTLQFFLNFVDFNMNLQAAIDAPSFYNQHFPSSFYPRVAEPGVLYIEDRISPSVRKDLKRRGHRVSVTNGWVNGRLTAVHRPQRGLLEAAASSRFQTPYAMGW